MGKKIKIGFLSEVDLYDITQLSGTSYNLRKIFEVKGYEVIPVDKLDQGFHFIRFYQKVKTKVYRKLLGVNYRPEWTKTGSKLLAKRAMKMIRKNKPDILFTWSTPILAHLDVNIPKILYTDATFSLMLGFYGNFSNFTSKSIDTGDDLAAKAFENADRLIFSSKWAANSALQNYGISERKVHVVTLGANLDVNHDEVFIRELIRSKSGKTLHLLFMGVDWKRKGGEKALEVARIIKEKGRKVCLHLMGSKPPDDKKLPDYVVNHGFVSKAQPEGRKHMDEIFRKVHFLVLPTFADCTPMVYAELNAYGIPAITHDVGGISSVVYHETNGLIFSTQSTAEQMAEKIMACFENPKQYDDLALSSFKTFKGKLNWSQTGESLSKHIHEVLEKNHLTNKNL